MTQKDIDNIIFQGKPTATRTWKTFTARLKSERLKWISTRRPLAATMINTKSLQEFFYPELDGIVVHLNKRFKEYKTATEAYDVAVKIKNGLIKHYG